MSPPLSPPPPFYLSDSEVDIEEDEPVNEVSLGNVCVLKIYIYIIYCGINCIFLFKSFK